MKEDVRKILGSYSKEVIIEWLCNSYFLPLARRDIKEELEDTRRDFEFNKIDKELTPLYAKQKKLGQKPFNVSVALEMEKNRERIKELLDKQEELLGIKEIKKMTIKGMDAKEYRKKYYKEHKMYYKNKNKEWVKITQKNIKKITNVIIKNE